MAGRAEVQRAVDHITGTVLAETGYDFSEYQVPFLLRRLESVAGRHGLGDSVLGLAGAVHAGSPLVAEIIEALGLAVTGMFRDPGFWAALRRQLRERPPPQGPIRCWVAGCATGQEAYSLSILLQESGLEDHLVYATDISEPSLTAARTCCRTVADWGPAEESYRMSGGTGDLRSYFADAADPAETFGRRILFARHNLATDAVFNSFHLVLCRNVMIYFNNDLRLRAHQKLYRSLLPDGLLCLGSRESLWGTELATCYRREDSAERIYRKVL